MNCMLIVLLSWVVVLCIPVLGQAQMGDSEPLVKDLDDYTDWNSSHSIINEADHVAWDVLSDRLIKTATNTTSNLSMSKNSGQLQTSIGQNIVIQNFKVIMDKKENVNLSTIKPLQLAEGYQLSILDVSFDGDRVAVKLLKNNIVVDTKTISLSNKAETNDTGIYRYIMATENGENVTVIEVHFKNAVRTDVQNKATVDRIWQISTPKSLQPNIAQAGNKKTGHPFLKENAFIEDKFNGLLKEVPFILNSSMKISDDKTLNVWLTLKTANDKDIQSNIIESMGVVVGLYEGVNQVFPFIGDMRVILASEENKAVLIAYCLKNWVSAVRSNNDSGFNKNDTNRLIVKVTGNLKALNSSWDKYTLTYMLKSGDYLNSINQYGGAIQNYDEVLALDKENLSALNGKGEALINMNRCQDAIPILNMVTEIDPNNARGWHNKGAAFNILSDYKNALPCFEKATNLNPNHLGSWNDRGLVLFKLGRFEEALACYDHALTIDPNNAMALVNKGADLVSLGRNQEALQLYEKATQMAPNWYLPWYNKGLALQRIGEDQQAREAFTKAKELGFRG